MQERPLHLVSILRARSVAQALMSLLPEIFHSTLRMVRAKIVTVWEQSLKLTQIW